MGKRTIWVKSSCFAPEFEMIIPVPDNRDSEEYIDELLDGILNDDLKYNVEWDFSDGISCRRTTKNNGVQSTPFIIIRQTYR